MVRREKSNYVIQSVSHALDVLEQFNGTVDEIGVTELSKRLKLHKNNVFRLLATLEARGYIEQNKLSENYRLGLRCLQLGQTFIHQMGLLLQSRAILEDLSKASKESAYVAIRKGSAIIPLDFVEPARSVRVVSFLGTVLPSHCTAAGKVHLVFGMDGTAGQDLPERLERYTEKTIVDRNMLREDMSRIGESLITTVGASYDQSKGDVGFSFLVEPRFLPKLNVTRRTGIEVPPAGAYGLE